HAPLRGATGERECSLQRRHQFQSTHPCGVRRVNTQYELYEVAVSIHAPLRGATPEEVAIWLTGTSFNPRTPAGCDAGGDALSEILQVSIHAPLRGATQPPI